jgi:mannose-6-phosphate isomerase-like protein (cupin superfamily)
MKPQITYFDPSGEFYTDERCHILELFNRPAYSRFSIARARVEPGVTTALHALQGTDEIYYLLAGKGRVEVDGGPKEDVQAGDLVIIPAGVSQRIANLGEEDLLFLCICGPRFEPAAYVDLEQTG